MGILAFQAVMLRRGGDMDGLSFLKLMEFAGQFGLPGLLLVLWFFNERGRERTLREYRDDTQDILREYRADMLEIRKFYERNVTLVQAYESLAKDLKDVVVMNTQAWTRAQSAINGNQFCPQVRLEKKAAGVQA